MSKKTEEKTDLVTGDSADELASAMYGVYSATLNVHNAVPLPSWQQLEELQKNAWRHVARGVK